jgi:hypothetical protein
MAEAVAGARAMPRALDTHPSTVSALAIAGGQCTSRALIKWAYADTSTYE